MNHYVSLAKLAVENYVKEKKIISPPENLPAAQKGPFRLRSEPRSPRSTRVEAGLWREEFLTKKSGVFVTIEKQGQLRGCIGTYLPTRENIAEEIIQNAIAAATEDYRFGPIKEEELSSLSYTVYILNKPELVKALSALNPKKYGIIVKTRSIFSSKNLGGQAENDVVFNGHMVAKTGLLLPDLEGVDTVEQQISIACQKGGINSEKEKIFIYRFTVEKYQ